MIARIWRGATSEADADAYLDYLRDTGIREYRDTPGNRGVYVLRRLVAGQAEFLLLSLWESMDAVTTFAGDDPTKAVFYPEDDRYLVDRGEGIDHFDVLEGP
jgi:heme-degrading monooxygenase HmoA